MLIYSGSFCVTLAELRLFVQRRTNSACVRRIPADLGHKLQLMSAVFRFHYFPSWLFLSSLYDRLTTDWRGRCPIPLHPLALPLLSEGHLGPWHGVTRGSGSNLSLRIEPALQEAVTSSLVVSSLRSGGGLLYEMIWKYRTIMQKKRNTSMLTLAHSQSFPFFKVVVKKITILLWNDTLQSCHNF